jgi:hypothetical protein
MSQVLGNKDLTEDHAAVSFRPSLVVSRQPRLHSLDHEYQLLISCSKASDWERKICLILLRYASRCVTYPKSQSNLSLENCIRESSFDKQHQAMNAPQRETRFSFVESLNLQA